MADRFTLYRGGRVVLYILGAALIAGPAAAMVAVFIGGGNLGLWQRMAIAGFAAGAAALGAGMLNAARQPEIDITPKAITIPTFFGTRRIEVREDMPLGVFLGLSKNATSTKGPKDYRKVDHFYTQDARGGLVLLTALHPQSLDHPKLMEALPRITGLLLERLTQDAATRRVRPDVSHWPKP